MYDNVLPEIENDRVLVPIRAVIESFGADVAWENATSTITITCGDTEIKMQPGNNIMIINGVEVESDVAPKIVGDRTLAPLRIIAETLKMEVDWDETSQTVIIDESDKPDQDDETNEANEPAESDESVESTETVE